MEKNYIIEKTLEGIDFSIEEFQTAEYDRCIFNSCNFSKCNLSDAVFTECAFNGCDMSLAKLGNTAIRDSIFKDCKMLGLRFENCNEFGLSFSFEDCILNDSSFYKLKTKKTIFKNCRMHDIDFSEADLSACVFDKCDLKGAVFNRTTLEKADLRTAFNYSIDPELNRIKKAQFSIPSVIGLLNKYDIKIALN